VLLQGRGPYAVHVALFLLAGVLFTEEVTPSPKLVNLLVVPGDARDLAPGPGANKNRFGGLVEVITSLLCIMRVCTDEMCSRGTARYK
jgi:hypothetical protein